jgi:hypothetical protein
MSKKIIFAIFPILLLIVLISVSASEQSCESSIGETCSNNDDCISCSSYDSYCTLCPKNTEMKIYIASDPYYARLVNDTTFIIRNGGQGYCAYPGEMSCTGNWNGNEYGVGFESLRNSENSLSAELVTNDVLSTWKRLATESASEEYFNEHFKLTFLATEIIENDSGIYDTGNDFLGVRINYNFVYDWAEATGGDNWDFITIAERKNGVWVKFTEDEMYNQYKKDLSERWRGWEPPYMPRQRLTMEEIDSIISEKQATSKLKECHSKIDIEKVDIYFREPYENIDFIANGRTSLNTHKCIFSHDSTYNRIRSSVNLITGELTCESHESPCVVYMSGEGSESRAELFNFKTILYILGFIVLLVLVIIFIKFRRSRQAFL